MNIDDILEDKTSKLMYLWPIWMQFVLLYFYLILIV